MSMKTIKDTLRNIIINGDSILLQKKLKYKAYQAFIKEPYTKAEWYGFSLSELEDIVDNSIDLQASANIYSIMLSYSTEHIILHPQDYDTDIFTYIRYVRENKVLKISPKVMKLLALLDDELLPKIIDVCFLDKLFKNLVYNKQWGTQEILNLGETKIPRLIRKDILMNWDYPAFWSLVKRFTPDQFDKFYNAWNIAVIPKSIQLLYYAYHGRDITYNAKDLYTHFLRPELHLEGGYLFEDTDALKKVTIYFCPSYNVTLLDGDFNGSVFIEEFIRKVSPNIASLLYSKSEFTEKEFKLLKDSTEPILSISDSTQYYIENNVLLKNVEIFGRKYKVKVDPNNIKGV